MKFVLLALITLATFHSHNVAAWNQNSCLMEYDSMSRRDQWFAVASGALAAGAAIDTELKLLPLRYHYFRMGLIAAGVVIPSVLWKKHESAEFIAGLIRESRGESPGPLTQEFTKSLNDAIVKRIFKGLGVAIGSDAEYTSRADLAKLLAHKSFEPGEVHRTIHLWDEQNVFCTTTGHILSRGELIGMMLGVELAP